MTTRAPSRARRTRSRRGLRLTAGRRSSTHTFHRLTPGHTAACAGADGVWYVDSAGGRVLWSPRDVDRDRRAAAFAPALVAAGVDSPVALAGGADALYATSCDDPRACRLARLDPAAGAVAWRPGSRVRPQPVAVLVRVVYAACTDGLRRDRRGRGAASASRSATCHRRTCCARRAARSAWTDPAGKLRRRDPRGAGGACEVIAASDARIEALDLDDDRAYLLDADGGVYEARRGAPKRTARAPEIRYGGTYAGIVRVGPYAVSAFQWDSSWAANTRLVGVALGYPHLADAPAELRAAASTDPSAAEVLADWLEERGIAVAAETVQRALASGVEGFDTRDRYGEVCGGIARELVTFDRELAYHVYLDRVVDSVSGAL